MYMMPRTDLALERRDFLMGASENELPGVKFKSDSISEIKYQIMEITDTTSAEQLGKPIGRYCTVEIEPVMRRESESFYKAARAASALLGKFLPEDKTEFRALVAGLGNRQITPDAIGPLAAEATLVTRHLKRFMPEDFRFFREVAVVTPGVLGTTGIESASFIQSLARCLQPDIVVLVDALAASSIDHLCRTLQITDTGITPGSGVGNSRDAINSDTLGVPVIAIGVPTVVDISALLPDVHLNAVEQEADKARDMIVTPRNIDSQVACIGRLLGYSINLSLHKGLTVEDIDMLLG